ncbi:MAG: hypothetical protein KC877_01115 [Candidatus Kaiserbacteria bacterium]|nr:hypothetical protein [Candidatus Kaiserbacteria bacterium]MCB9816503.1 hypothetical protein [Candidatus Nomurabacteria bacterium]
MKFAITLLFVALPSILLAAAPTYEPLVGIPGVPANSDLNTYINALYALSIIVAALLAVIKIIIAGVKWMMTDIVTSKSEAKKDIQGALLGLLIVLGAVIILTVINPDIVKVNLNMDRLTTKTTLTKDTKVALDASKVQTVNIPGAAGATMEVMPESAGVDQKIALQESCPSTAGTTGGVGQAQQSFLINNESRCFTFDSAQYTSVYQVPRCQTEACDVVFTRAEDSCKANGVLQLDPTYPNVAWCLLKK